MQGWTVELATNGAWKVLKHNLPVLRPEVTLKP